jgi:amidase
VVGLKTTGGRIPLSGVWPLAPTLDTVGPIAATVAGVVTGMRLLEPGFTPAPSPARRIGRFRLADENVDPGVEAAVDAALDRAAIAVVPVELPGWDDTWEVFDAILLAELWRAHHRLLDAPGLGEWVAEGIRAGQAVTSARLAAAMEGRRRWRADLAAVLAEVDLIALPTLPAEPPPVTGYGDYRTTMLTAPFNVAGVPALALPVPGPDLPTSLQLVGPTGSEELLAATGALIEAAR